MSTSQRAKQLLALLETLEPLDDKSRGMPVEATEWNAIIDILRELLLINRDQDEELSGRLVQNFAPAEHEHLGEVTLSWLDASLQERFAEAGDGVATRQALAKMQKSLESLRAQVARLTEEADDQTIRLDRFRIDELDRSRLLKSFDDRFEGLAGLRTSVNRLARSQGALKNDVTEVLSLRERLTDANGDPIDLSRIAVEVEGFQDVREALTDINGQPFRLRDLQIELIELRDTLPADAGGNLDGKLAELEAGLQERFDEREAANLATLREEITTQLDDSRTGFDTRLEESLAAERQSLILTVRDLDAASEARSSELIAERLANERDGLREFAREVTFGEVSSRLDIVSESIDTRVESRLAGFETSLRDDLSSDIERQLEAGLAASDERLGTRIEGLDTALASVQSTLDSRIEDALGNLTPAIEARLTERLNSNIENVRGDLSGMVSDSVNEGVLALMPDLRRAASEAVSEGISGIDQRIEAAVAQSTLDIQNQVTTQIKNQIDQANISGQIAAANAQLEESLREEISISAANLQSKNNEALNNALITMRGEFVRGDFGRGDIGRGDFGRGGRIITPTPFRPGG